MTVGPTNGDVLRCRHCDEVIGVYEPMVVCSEGMPVHTSLAAMGPDAEIVGAHYFHSECFALRNRD